MVKSAKAIAESDRQDELARILCERAEADARHGLFTEAEQTVGSLEETAAQVPSVNVQHAFNEAEGAVLVYEGKYDEAIPFLEQNSDNTFSIYRLAYAAQRTGKVQLANERLKELTEYRQPTPEQAFVTPVSGLTGIAEPLSAEKH